MLPPAEAGAHLSAARAAGRWVPAFPTELVPWAEGPRDSGLLVALFKAGRPPRPVFIGLRTSAQTQSKDSASDRDKWSHQIFCQTGEGRCPWQNWVPAFEAVRKCPSWAHTSSSFRDGP